MSRILLEKAQRTLADAEKRFDEALESIETADDAISETDLAALNTTLDETEADVVRSRTETERLTRIYTAREESREIVIPEEEKRLAVKTRESIYRPDSATSFFRDLLHSREDSAALERLTRNNEYVAEKAREKGETRANATGTGFLPPIYLGEEWAGLPHPGRPFANALPNLNLPPDGVTFTVPVVTGAASVAAHTDGGSSVSETAMVTSTVSHTLIALAGQNQIDRVVLERSFPGLDMVIFDELQRLYDGKVDNELLVGNGSAGHHLGLDSVSGINTVTYTDASPTVKLVLTSIYQGMSKVLSTRFLPATAIIMSPRRATWMAAGFDSTFPVFNQGGLNSFQIGSQENGVVGMIAGMPVIVDPNVPATKGVGTNQDTIYVVRIEDLLFGEEPLQRATYQEVLSNDLAVRLQVVGYSLAILDRYPTAICAINGTGLAAPAGF